MSFLKRKVKEVKPPEPTVEEKREILLKNNIGKHIILFKAKEIHRTVQKVIKYDYDLGGNHYEDELKEYVSSAETIEGTLQDAATSMVKVDNQWYVFGYEPEKIYECNIIF